jgi:hypothetical protein
MVQTVVSVERAAGYVMTNGSTRLMSRNAAETLAATPAAEIALLNPEQIPASIHALMLT